MMRQLTKLRLRPDLSAAGRKKIHTSGGLQEPPSDQHHVARTGLIRHESMLAAGGCYVAVVQSEAVVVFKSQALFRERL